MLSDARLETSLSPQTHTSSVPLEEDGIDTDKRSCRHQGKVQEEELDSCRAADVRRYVTPSQNRWRH